MSELIDRSAQPETHDKRTGTHACDLIDRQQAIDALYHVDEYNGRSVEAIRNLPSAQPVLTCDGCRHVGTYDTDFPCNGCVRREKDYYDPER